MTDSKERFYAFNEGLPTKPDVDLLLSTWPNPKIGDRFEYEVIAKLLHIEIGSVRFKTVTNNWRRRWLEKGFVIECDVGKAFFVANAEQIMGKTYGTLQFIGRKARHHRTKLSQAKVETDLQRAAIEWQARSLLEMEREAKKKRMNLLPPTEIKEPHKIAPPKENKK